MFNSVQYIREICRQRKIPISQLEKDCGFSNGYLNPKKISKISYDRAKKVAEYLGISVSSIMGEGETEKTLVDIDKRSASKEEVMFALFRGREHITEEMYNEVLNFAEYVAQREEVKKKED